MGQNFAGMLNQRGQQLVLDRRQVHLGVADQHMPPRQIHTQLANRLNRVVDRLPPRAACRSATRIRASSSPTLKGLVR